MTNANDPNPEAETVEFDNRASNPNSGGDLGLSGDMGVSSERTGPAGRDPRQGGIAGTGSKGGSVSGTDGELDTTPTEHDAPDVSNRELADHEVNDAEGGYDGLDRTVGEPRPNTIPDEKSRR